MVSTYGQWFEEEDYSTYPEDRWCFMDYMAVKIRKSGYKIETNMEHLIDMCDLYWRGYILDETHGYSFCDTERDVESLSIKEQADDCWEYVEASGGLREFDFEP